MNKFNYLKSIHRKKKTASTLKLNDAINLRNSFKVSFKFSFDGKQKSAYYLKRSSAN